MTVFSLSRLVVVAHHLKIDSTENQTKFISDGTVKCTRPLEIGYQSNSRVLESRKETLALT